MLDKVSQDLGEPVVVQQLAPTVHQRIPHQGFEVFLEAKGFFDLP